MEKIRPWAERKKDHDFYIWKSRKCVRIGTLGLASVVVAYYTNTLTGGTMTKTGALFLSAFTYASTYVASKLSADFSAAASDPHDIKRAFRENFSKPLKGFPGLVPLIAAFSMANATAEKAATQEYEAIRKRAYALEMKYAKPLDKWELIGEKKNRPAALFCRGEDVKYVSVKGELRKLHCGGLNLGPKL